MISTPRSLLVLLALGASPLSVLACSGAAEDANDEATGGSSTGGTSSGGSSSGGATGGAASGGANGSGGTGADGNQSCTPGGTDPADTELCAGGADISRGLQTAVTAGSTIAYSIQVTDSTTQVTLLGESDACSEAAVTLLDESLEVGTHCFLIKTPSAFTRLRSQLGGSGLTSETFCPAGTCPAD